MEQGHGRISDVVGRELEHHRHPVPRREEPVLRAADSLRSGRRPRGEQQRPQDVDIGFGRCDLVRRSGTAGGPGCFERSVERLPRDGRIVAVGKAVGDEDANGQVHLLDGRTELGLVSRFGDHELHVGMVDVAGEVLPVSGVVQPHDGGPDQPRATQREDVVGRVVEEDTDMRGAVGTEAGAKQCGKALCFGEELGSGSTRGRRNEARVDRSSARRCRSGAAGRLHSEQEAPPRPAAGRRWAALRRAWPQHIERPFRPLGQTAHRLPLRPSMATRKRDPD